VCRAVDVINIDPCLPGVKHQCIFFFDIAIDSCRRWAYIVDMSYDVGVSKPGKGGRSAWVEREGDERVLWSVNLYRSQLEWVKRRPGGGAEWLRQLIDRHKRREEREKARRDDE
jgi:hypothetical protein